MHFSEEQKRCIRIEEIISGGLSQHNRTRKLKSISKAIWVRWVPLAYARCTDIWNICFVYIMIKTIVIVVCWKSCKMESHLVRIDSNLFGDRQWLLIIVCNFASQQKQFLKEYWKTYFLAKHTDEKVLRMFEVEKLSTQFSNMLDPW